MSTQTPNYNLEKPDATDAFGLFRQLFNDNMDIIDQNLGGGGGGGGGGGDITITHEIIRQTNVSISDGLSVTLNVTKNYSSPYVVALNSLPLISWGGLVYLQDSTQITYDSNAKTLTFNVYTNSAQNYNIDWLVFEKTSSIGVIGDGGQIVDLSLFTKIYDNTIPFGNYGAKIDTILDYTNEVVIALNMQAGWNSANSSSYDSENQIGAYGGYEFNSALKLDRARFYLGRYSGQNLDLTATVQYLDSGNIWHDVEDLNVSTTIDYPINSFDVDLSNLGKIYGLRWYHYKNPEKSPSNNICFFGMLLYKQGSGNGGGYSVKYSTSVREVGEWIDGSVVCDVTFSLNPAISCNSQGWTDTGIPKGSIKKLLQAQVLSADGAVFNGTNVNITTNTDHIGIYNTSLESISVKEIVVQYVKKEIPQNLHLIEYIESTGTQWIDSGINEGGVYEIEFGFMPVSETSAYQSYLSGTLDDFTIGSTINFDRVYVRHRSNEIATNNVSLVAENLLAIKNGKESINGVDVTNVSTSNPVSTSNSSNIFIFDNPSHSRPSAMRLYSLKMYGASQNLVFDGVPVKDANGVPCIFDYVSVGYIYNGGTGDFIAGGDV